MSSTVRSCASLSCASSAIRRASCSELPAVSGASTALWRLLTPLPRGTGPGLLDPVRHGLGHEAAGTAAPPPPARGCPTTTLRSCGIAKKLTRSSATRDARQRRPHLVPRRPPSRSATANGARRRTRSGSRHCGRRAAWSAPSDEHELVIRLARVQRLERLHRVGAGPACPPRARDTSSPSAPAPPARTGAAAPRAPGVVLDLPVGRARRPASAATRSSPSCQRASCAQIRWPMCGGLKAPPRMPTRRCLPGQRSRATHAPARRRARRT